MYSLCDINGMYPFIFTLMAYILFDINVYITLVSVTAHILFSDINSMYSLFNHSKYSPFDINGTFSDLNKLYMSNRNDMNDMKIICIYDALCVIVVGTQLQI